MSFGNIDAMIRLKPSNLVSIHVALFLDPLKDQFNSHGKPTAMKEEQMHNLEG